MDFHKYKRILWDKINYCGRFLLEFFKNIQYSDVLQLGRSITTVQLPLDFLPWHQWQSPNLLRP